ncbi:type II toxin-antitoxin system Rv0910 family toxin [Nocardioides stalactiti]|uniref:type II toxin-antitoxin system Rv0910 family toxin n=1 Tax=Nocardioides stalactiti TaxID=2755356 RepID=UPI0015FF4FBE|nr:SRPBCC family protein [Nocardioides stalactiti]
MAQIRVSETVPVPIDRAWELVSDLQLFDAWLSLHDGWRSDVPAELYVGLEVASVVKAKGLRNRVTWTVTAFDPPSNVRLSGVGVGGTKVALEFTLKTQGSGTAVTLNADFSHPLLKGPMGSVAGRTITGDLKASMKRLVGIAGERG